MEKDTSYAVGLANLMRFCNRDIVHSDKIAPQMFHLRTLISLINVALRLFFFGKIFQALRSY